MIERRNRNREIKASRKPTFSYDVSRNPCRTGNGGIYYYYLGNQRIVMDVSGSVVQVNNYYPSGATMADYPRRTDQGIQPYKFGGKELDRSNGLDFYDFEARSFDPALMRFTMMDPLAEKYYNISPYAYCLNNPMRYIDPTGMGPWDMAKFALRHPMAALAIGFVSRGSSNISTTSARFAWSIGLTENNGPHEGSQVNAARHAIWQASITSIFGQDIAQQAGNAHEDNPNVDLSIRTFSGDNALNRADQTIDLLNNQIGQEIGNKNMGATIKELTNIVLDVFNKDGLFTATQNANGSVTVTRTKLSNEQLNQAKDRLNNLSENGMTAEEQRKLEEEQQRQYERNQNQFGTIK